MQHSQLLMRSCLFVFSGEHQLRVELETFAGGHYFAEYSHFRVDSESSNFRLEVSGYSGTAGDSLSSAHHSHSGHSFSTFDRDNDERFLDNCARLFRGAWWFNDCFQSHLNGEYRTQADHDDFLASSGIQWRSLHAHASLKSVQMMIT